MKPQSSPPDRRRRRRCGPLAVLVLVLVVAPALFAPPPAAALIPVTDVAHIALNSYWHYVHYLQFAYQIAQQVEQIVFQLRQLAKLSNPNWRDIQALLAQLDTVMRSGRSLSYSLPDPGGQFRQLYPGWAPWSDPTAPQVQSARALDTLRAGLVATSNQAQSLAPGEQLLARIRQQMTSTDGHQQALELLATLAAFIAQEQLLTRQALAIANNQAAVAQGYWLNRQAQGDASFSLLLTETSIAGSRSSSPGWTFRLP
jgi:P-type conjugative transfer protein TrbJ